MRKRLFNQQSEPRSREAQKTWRLSVKAKIMMALIALLLIPQGAWAQTNYDLLIGNVKVTSANKDNIAAALHKDSIEVGPGGSITFDPTWNILTLNNVELKREITSELPKLTIRFVGNNKVNTDALITSRSANNNAVRTSTVTATLTFEKSGDGTLELNGLSGNSAVRGFSSVSYGSGDAQCYLHTDYPTTYGDYYNQSSVITEKCYSNFCTGGVTSVVTISSEVRYPLWIATGPLTAKQVTSTTITDGVTAGSVTFTPPTATTSSKLTLNGATLNAKILSALGNLELSITGLNKITSPDTGTIVRSVNKGELTIGKTNDNAALELEISGYDNHPVIQGFHTLSYSDFDLNTSATTPTYYIFDDGYGPVGSTNNIYGLYDDGSSPKTAIKQATFAKNYDLWVNGTRVTSANASNIGPSGTDFSFDPTESTLHYRSGGSTAYPVLSGLQNLTIKIGSPDNSGDYSKNNISIIKFGAPTGVAIAATSGTLTLSKEDGVTGVQQFDIVAYGSESLIQGFDNVTYSDFVILRDGVTYNTTNKKLEYPDPSGSGVKGLDETTTFVTPQDISNYYVADIANKDYTGSALAPTITVMETATSITSLVENTDYTVRYELSGAVATLIDANTYNVIIDGKGRYTGSITTKTFTIDPLAVTLIWGGSTFTYDGESHKPNASATGLIGSDVCNVTVSGEQTNASATAYTATATALDNSNYKLPTSVTQTFVINPLDLSTSTDLYVGTISAQTYSASEIKPEPTVSIKLGNNTTATTLKAGTDFDFSYTNNINAADKSATPAPTVTITGKGNYTGEKNVKFTITPATVSITAPNEAVTYNGTAQNYTSATGSGTFVVTYYATEGDRTNNKNALTGAPTNANTYYVKVSQSDNNYSSTDALATFKIDPLTATLNWTNTSFTYDGSAHVPTATVTNLVGTDACNVTVTGTETNASSTSYTATATALSNTNYALPTDVTQTFTIAPVTATLNWTNTMFTYDGTAHVPTATVTNLIGTDACSVTVTGEKTDASASSYTATATALSNTNYALPTDVTKDFTIAPAVATLSWTNTSFTYDGNAHAPTATVTNLIGTDACSVTVTGEKIDASASSYTATATALSNTNYALPTTVTQNFTIAPLTATLSWGNTTFVYNGTAQVPTATVTNLVGTDVCNVTVGGAETAAGSYTATATALSNANYQLPASPTTTFTILDRTATIDFGDRTFKTYYDANETFIVPDGTTAYIVTGVSGNAVTIQKVSYIKAGVPVLLESTPGSTVAKNASETFTGNLLKYAAAATPATEKHYLLYQNEFVRASGTISNKVYLDLTNYSGGARSLVIGDGATAIEGIIIDEEDGDAKWYDMQGRRINKPTKAGLYIKDGQKVVVKTRY